MDDFAINKNIPKEYRTKTPYQISWLLVDAGIIAPCNQLDAARKIAAYYELDKEEKDE